MRLLPYMLAKLNAMPSAQKWLGLRISYGMNGILLRSEDLKSFATYMRYAHVCERSLSLVHLNHRHMCQP